MHHAASHIHNIYTALQTSGIPSDKQDSLFLTVAVCTDATQTSGQFMVFSISSSRIICLLCTAPSLAQIQPQPAISPLVTAEAGGAMSGLFQSRWLNTSSPTAHPAQASIAEVTTCFGEKIAVAQFRHSLFFLPLFTILFLILANALLMGR